MPDAMIGSTYEYLAAVLEIAGQAMEDLSANLQRAQDDICARLTPTQRLSYDTLIVEGVPTFDALEAGTPSTISVS